MIVRRAAVAVSVVLLGAVSGCSTGATPGAAPGTAPGPAAATDKDERGPRPTSVVTPTWDPLDPDGPTPSDRIEPEPDVVVLDEATSVPGPSVTKASVSVYAGVDRTGRVHLGGRVATKAQRRALLRNASAEGRDVDAALLRVVPRRTDASVDRAVATLGDYLAVAPDGDGSLLLWMLDRTLVAQVRDPAVQHYVPVSRTGTAALLRAGGVDVVVSAALQVRGDSVQTEITDTVDGEPPTFAAGSARLTGAARGLLDHLLPWLTVEYPDVRLLVTGHATATEPDAGALALRRAHAVRDYLVARGVAAERLGVLGYGDDQAGYHVTYGDAGRYELSVVG